MDSRLVEELRDVLAGVTANLGPDRPVIRLWDGSEIRGGEASHASTTIVVRHPSVVGLLLDNPSELELVEAYMADLVDVEGSFDAAFDMAVGLFQESDSGMIVRLRRALRALRLRRSLRLAAAAAPDASGPAGDRLRVRRAVNFHYDLPLRFWKLWLDENLVYSCAYYESADASLKDAQVAKLDHICRKLGLRPGLRLLDIGCGWGGLVIHACRHYGVEGHGITLSEKQARYATERARDLGLERCTFEVRDFRDVEGTGIYDRVASVGAVEHVREDMFSSYFRTAFRVLKPRGLFLSHGITRPGVMRDAPQSPFIRRYVFPDTHLPTIDKTLSVAESEGFETRDVENLREHYARTTGAWYEKLRSVEEAATALVDRAVYRKFVLMLAGTSWSFRTGLVGLHQSLLGKPDRGEIDIPATRGPWYGVVEDLPSLQDDDHGASASDHLSSRSTAHGLEEDESVRQLDQ